MVPTANSKFGPYITNFNTRIVASPSDYQLSAPQVAQHTALYDVWLPAAEACVEGNRSPALRQARDDAKRPLLQFTRELYQFIQANTAVTNENKQLIGVVVRDFEPTPTPNQTTKPVVSVQGVNGRVVSYRASYVGTPNSRKKAPGARGILLFSYVGENPPSDVRNGWKPEGQTQRTDFEVQFPESVQPGEKCWISATWVGERGEWGPAGDGVSAYLHIGPNVQAA